MIFGAHWSLKLKYIPNIKETAKRFAWYDEYSRRNQCLTNPALRQRVGVLVSLQETMSLPHGSKTRNELAQHLLKIAQE